MKKNRIETDIMHLGEDPKDYNSAVVPPMYQNSLFVFDGWDELDRAFDDKPNQFIYSRGNNPTVTLVSKKIAALAKGEKAQLFPSGMAAITAACMHYLRPGDHVITINNIYGPAYNLFEKYLSYKMKISTSFVEGAEISDFEKVLRDNTRLIYLESPASVVFSLQDIESVVKLAKAHNIKTIIDNTWATPLFQQPLAMGVDLEVHSTSKYLGGHSDL
ncbi:MAG: trans-sulfuration enzyme family protein, partial [Flavobacteriaceae bacterium]